ncbi:MAG: hypothetical protein FJY85_04755 [Deltaproteobacteria bacterium]|nr:hypothetical protein [Deltaproteobacteria bacterium]
MAEEPSRLVRRFYGLLVVLVVLQAAAVALVIRFAWDRSDRERTLLDRTGLMIDRMLPTLQSDVSEVSRKATELKVDLSQLRSQVSKVDEHLGQVGRDVSDVGRSVHKVDTNLTSFVQDKSGLIWGHSLNPYVLLGLLAALAATIPLSGWFFATRRRAQETREPLSASAMESFSVRLDGLSLLVEKIRKTEQEREKPTPELQELMLQTERLIQEARTELGQLSPSPKPTPQDPDTKTGELH